MGRFAERASTLKRIALAQFRYLRRETKMLVGRTCATRELRQVETDGFSILVDVSEEVGRCIYLGRFEREEVRFLESKVRPGDVCFDVGANVGFFTLMMAKFACEGYVYAFEPVRFNFDLLSVSVRLNHLENVEVFHGAVSDRSGTAEFVVASDAAYSSFVDTGRNPVSERVTVETTSLDDFCERRAIGRIDCLKVDVEGAEPLVLKGGRQILSDPARRPRVVILELYSPMLKLYGASIPEIVSSMSEFGYAPFVEYAPSRLRSFTAQDFDINQNVLFIPV